MTSTKGRKLSTIAKLREARNTIMELQVKLKLVEVNLDAARSYEGELARVNQRAKQELSDSQELAQRGAARDAKELREQRDQTKALLDTCEKLIAVIALPSGPEHAQRRSEVLVEALSSTRSFHPFA